MTSLFSSPLNLSTFAQDSKAFDHVYGFFERDFKTQKTHLAKTIYLDPGAQGIQNGRERVFWHITTREEKKKVKEGNRIVEKKSRPLDRNRASRIQWIRPMLQNHVHGDIKLFYRKESAGKRPIRLYLWAHQRDFVVIVQKLGASRAFLVTTFYITETYKRTSYNKLHKEYTSGTNPVLNGCEWF